MTRANVALGNFAGGEVSALMHSRVDLPVYKRGVERAQNFIVLPQGPVDFRCGFRRVHHTRLNQKAVLMRFQFNDQQAYQIEVTNGYFRFYKDEGIITETPVAITAITTGNPTTITSSALRNGDEVFLDDIVGTVSTLNGKSYLVSNVSGTTFRINDIDGNPIDTTGLAYTSGGTVSRIYEIKTPYREQDLDTWMDEDICTIQHTQNTDTMYIDHRSYEPRKLTRSGHANWTLARYSRTADPFDSAKAITGITAANPGVFTSASHGRAVGDKVYIDSVVGMTEVNDRHYTINTVPTVNTFTLKDEAGNVLNTSTYTAYSSGGKLEFIGGTNYPRAVTFTADARVLHGGTGSKPETIWASRSPDTTGPRYDDFTTGTDATHACIFTLSAVNGEVNPVQWLSNTDKFIVAGTFGTVRRIYGATEQESITPNGINAKPVNGYGSALASSVSLGANLFYIQRGTQGIRSLEYDYAQDGYLTTDRNLVSDHLPYPGLQQMAFQVGRPDILWVTRKDGVLLGLTYKDKEDISGWHRHLLGGAYIDANNCSRPFGRCLWVSCISRPTAQEQLWAVVEREINGQTRRSVEFMMDAPIYPDPIDFYTGDEEDDRVRYLNAVYEVQKNAVYLDNSLTYDGRSYGEQAGADLTIGASTVTASTGVFTADMVGREIWGAYDANGEGGGRAVITGYTSSTQVTVDITVDFGFSSLESGSWYLTTDTVSGLDYLEGETVGVTIDGGPDNDATVEDGSVTVSAQASVITVGQKYVGIFKSLNLDLGGVTGSAQTKLRNCIETKINFLNSVNAKFGTNLYKMSRLEFRQAEDFTDRPIPPFNGVKSLSYSDDWDDKKNAYVIQDSPSPCTVTVLDIYTETTDE